MKKKHGMQMGGSGFGITHGEMGEGGSDDISHEFRGHGVSDKWIQTKVAKGSRMAGASRIGAFVGKLGAQNSEKVSEKRHVAIKAAVKAKNSNPHAAMNHDAHSKGVTSGWAAWKAKHGK